MSRTPPQETDKLTTYVSNKLTNKQLDQTTVLLKVVAWVHYFN